MDLNIRTGSRKLADHPPTMSPLYSTLMPIMFDPTMEPDEWALYDGDEPVGGPLTITGDYEKEMRLAFKRATTPPGEVTYQLPEPPATPPPKKVAKVEPPTPVALSLDQVTKEILGLQKRTVRNYIEIGRWLHEAKKLASHGHWLEYLEHNVFLSEYQAQSCMKMFTDWGANPHLIEDLNFSKVILIGQAKPEVRPILIELAKTAPTATVEQAVREANKSPEPISSPPTPPQEPVPPVQPPTPAQSTAKATTASKTEPDASAQPSNREATRFNSAVKHLLNATATSLPFFEKANGSAETGGDGFGLNSVYALQDALSAVQGHLVRVISECARQKGD